MAEIETARLLPRVVIAGTSGGSGKTVLSLALLLAARKRGIEVRAFKKGPDYIDAAWLGWAAGRPAYNLDTFLMGFETAAGAFARHAAPEAWNLIEGNRGLYDGVDLRGTHSTAALAKTLHAPVLLMLNVAKMTATAPALVLGCQKLDPGINIAGVVLNRVNGERHERILREAVQSVCGIPVLGALPAMEEDLLLPERHLGLVTPAEYSKLDGLAAKLGEWAEEHVDLDGVLKLSRGAPALAVAPLEPPRLPAGERLRIGYLRDSAFCFYYADNLEALESAGCTLVPISPLSDAGLPLPLDALYIGGGFPETHGAALQANADFLQSLRTGIRAGLPVYAECGGLMLLSESLRWQGQTYGMAGILPLSVEMCSRPQGHGYTELRVDTPNPFYPVGTTLKGHEFHYSRIQPTGTRLPTACEVLRGTGSYPSRDGLMVGGVWASYTHVHALATPEWAAGVVQAAANYRRSKLQSSAGPDASALCALGDGNCVTCVGRFDDF